MGLHKLDRDSVAQQIANQIQNDIASAFKSHSTNHSLDLSAMKETIDSGFADMQAQFSGMLEKVDSFFSDFKSATSGTSTAGLERKLDSKFRMLRRHLDVQTDLLEKAFSEQSEIIGSVLTNVDAGLIQLEKHILESDRNQSLAIQNALQSSLHNATQRVVDKVVIALQAASVSDGCPQLEYLNSSVQQILAHHEGQDVRDREMVDNIRREIDVSGESRHQKTRRVHDMNMQELLDLLREHLDEQTETFLNAKIASSSNTTLSDICGLVNSNGARLVFAC